jgi:mono/diheme cytochrome c family protein
MQARNIHMLGKVIFALVFGSVALNGLVYTAFSQPVIPAPAGPRRMAPPQQIGQSIPAPAAIAAVPPSQSQPNPLDLLVWDSVQKEQTTIPGQATADYIFKVSNPSETPVKITDALGSCSCTVAQLPSKPWILSPHTNTQLGVSVNLAGKSGTVVKTVTVRSGAYSKMLIVTVHIPESPEMTRQQNQQLARVDPQRVFQGDCAECHAKPAAGLMGKALYVKACGICHEAQPRATMVTDLHNINHPTDFAYWKTVIANGKPPTAMPAFALEHGGPLSDAQIDSLAKTLTQSFPYRASIAQAPMVNPKTANPVQFQMMGTPPVPHN